MVDLVLSPNFMMQNWNTKKLLAKEPRSFFCRERRVAACVSPELRVDGGYKEFARPKNQALLPRNYKEVP